MNIIDIIDKKRLNYELNYEELAFAFNSYLNKSIRDYQMASLLMAININGLSLRETVDLTDIFVKSGKTLNFDNYGITIDKHSTGGVGDKVTLILGPILASLGFKFPKMSGKGLGYTGGTIDKLQSIPGFNVDLTQEQILKQISNIGISISSQTTSIVPLDKVIYDLRNASGTVNSIPLIAVSIMSKKIALGAKIIFIDIKCGKGALIHQIEEAKHLENIMHFIAKEYNLQLITEITEMNIPLGDNVGNALEIIEAMEILQGKQCQLTDLVINFASRIISIANKISSNEAKTLIKTTINNGNAYHKFIEMVKYQGGRLEKLKVASNIIEIKSNKQGVLKNIDAFNISKLVFNLGSGRLNKEDKIDYETGIILNKKVNDKIELNDLLMKVYFNKPITINQDDYFEIE